MTMMAEKKYYFIMAKSINELLTAVNNQNERALRTYGKETVLRQVIELILAPGEFVAICQDIPSPPQTDLALPDQTREPHIPESRKLPPLQTVVED